MTKFIMAGFGGQGVLSLGQFMAESGLKEGKEVSYLPAYGPEMRGGTANCGVVVSETPISSPLVSMPDVLVAMNTPSLIKFQDKVKAGGLIIVNSSLIDVKVEREDVKVLYVPANDLALTAGNTKAANMVMAGVICGALNVVKAESIEACIQEKFGVKPKLVEINEKAYKLGFEEGKKI